MASRELVSRDLRRLALADGAVDYMLVRRRGRRGVGLKVDATGLTVSAPATMALAKVEALVRESERWIVRKTAAWSARRTPRIEWVDGAGLPYLGGTLTLHVATGPRPRVERAGDRLWVIARQCGEEQVRRAVTGWYKRAADDHLAARVHALSRAAGLAPPRLMLSSALGRWGSCNSRRELRLAWRLVKAPRELVDYVICHELAHLRHMNHSGAFWAEVERQCPDYRRLRDELFTTDCLYRSF